MGQQKRFLITGTGARVGKTTVGCALGFALRARGMRVGVMKPLDTASAAINGALESGDAQALALAVGSTASMEVICTYRYGSTPAAAEAQIDVTRIARCFNEIAAQNDAVLVESAGTIDAPIDRGHDFADLAAMLGLEVIIVAGNRAGCAEAVTHALQRCASRSLQIAGYILCDCDRAIETIDESLTRISGGSYLGRIRQREPLPRAIVEKLIQSAI